MSTQSETNDHHDDCRDKRSGSVPPGVPAWVTPELIAETLRVWQPYYAAPLTPDDAVGIILTVGQLFRVLSSGSPP